MLLDSDVETYHCRKVKITDNSAQIYIFQNMHLKFLLCFP